MFLLVINLSLTFPNSVFNCCIAAHEKFIFSEITESDAAAVKSFPYITIATIRVWFSWYGYGSTVLTFATLVTNMFFVCGSCK